MANLLNNLLHTSAVTVLVDTTLHDNRFRIVAPGLLGQEYFTSSALTAQILALPDYDQLLGPQKAQHILQVVLSQMQHDYAPPLGPQLAQSQQA